MRAVRQGGIIPAAHSVLAVVFQRNLNQPGTWPVGVSTYLALTFSTLLSSQGTDASFVLTLSGFPPGASLRYLVFPTLSDSFASDFLGAFPVPAPRFRFAFPFRRFRLYQILSGLIPGQRDSSSRLLGRSDVQNPSGFPPQLIIGPMRSGRDASAPESEFQAAMTACRESSREGSCWGVECRDLAQLRCCPKHLSGCGSSGYLTDPAGACQPRPAALLSPGPRAGPRRPAGRPRPCAAAGSAPRRACSARRRRDPGAAPPRRRWRAAWRQATSRGPRG